MTRGYRYSGMPSENDAKSAYARIQSCRGSSNHRADYTFVLQPPLENRWLKDALARTEYYYRHGPRGPATWVLTLGKDLPEGAFNASSAPGREVEPVYVARSFLQVTCQILVREVGR